MKKLKIGIFPLKKDLSAAGDRRRILPWALSRGHKVYINEDRGMDLVYLSEASNFLRLTHKSSVPKIFDLIDPYLIADNFFEDYLRGSLKLLSWREPPKLKKFSSIVRDAVSQVDLVVCSSPEQAKIIRPFNSNVFDILDNHDEIPLQKPQNSQGKPSSFSLLWEGSPHTLEALIDFTKDVYLPGQKFINAVTDSHRYRILNKYFPLDVDKYCKKKMLNTQFNLLPWSPSSLVEAAQRSDLSIVPVKACSKFHSLKPENRVMIMFRLGIPVVASATPSHLRVESLLGFPITASTSSEWNDRIEAYFKDSSFRKDAIRAGQLYLDVHHNSELLFRKWDNVVSLII